MPSPSQHRKIVPKRRCDHRYPFPLPYVSFNPEFFDAEQWSIPDLVKLCKTLNLPIKEYDLNLLTDREQLHLRAFYIHHLRHWHKTPLLENARRRKGTTNFALLQVDIPIESSPEQATQPQSSQTNLTASQLTPLRQKARRCRNGAPLSILTQNGAKSPSRREAIEAGTLTSPSDPSHLPRHVKHSIYNGTKLIPPRADIYRGWLLDAGIDPDLDSDDEFWNSPTKPTENDPATAAQTEEQRLEKKVQAAQKMTSPEQQRNLQERLEEFKRAADYEAQQEQQRLQQQQQTFDQPCFDDDDDEEEEMFEPHELPASSSLIKQIDEQLERFTDSDFSDDEENTEMLSPEKPQTHSSVSSRNRQPTPALALLNKGNHTDDDDDDDEEDDQEEMQPSSPQPISKQHSNATLVPITPAIQPQKTTTQQSHSKQPQAAVPVTPTTTDNLDDEWFDVCDVSSSPQQPITPTTPTRQTVINTSFRTATPTNNANNTSISPHESSTIVSCPVKREQIQAVDGTSKPQRRPSVTNTTNFSQRLSVSDLRQKQLQQQQQQQQSTNTSSSIVTRRYSTSTAAQNSSSTTPTPAAAATQQPQSRKFNSISSNQAYAQANPTPNATKTAASGTPQKVYLTRKRSSMFMQHPDEAKIILDQDDQTQLNNLIADMQSMTINSAK